MTGTNNNDNAKPDGQAVRLTRDVMPMATLETLKQTLIAERDREHQKYWEAAFYPDDDDDSLLDEDFEESHVGGMQHGFIMGLSHAIDEIEKIQGLSQSTQHEDRKTSPTPSA